MSKLDITFSPELIDRIALAHEQIELDSVNQSEGNKQYVLNLLYDPDSGCLLYTSPSPRDRQKSRMPSSA